MNQICDILGISRQGYYKGRKKKEIKNLHSGMIIQLVECHRRKMPKIGGKKLYRMLLPDLGRMEIKLGRDKFFRLLGYNLHKSRR